MIKDAVAWVQGLVSRPVNSIAGFFNDLQGYSATFSENRELKLKLEDYQQLQANLLLYQDENQRLKELLDYQTASIGEYELLAAKVVARSPDKWNNMLVIDKGSVHGIENDMTVITSEGFVGKVYKTSYYSANVQLVTDISHNSFVFARIHSEPALYGTIEGYDKIKNLLKIRQSEHDVKVEPGTYVTTSSLGGVFADGIVIGRVTDVINDDASGLNKTIYIKPSADLYHLEEVFVITDYVQLADEDD